MTSEIISLEEVPWKSLRRIPDIHLKGPDREDNGQAYSTFLRDLQIKPDEYERFFEGNVRLFRNKKDIAELIAKGDDESLLQVSKKYLTAYGKLGWEKQRKWLLPVNELEDNEKPLQYVYPRHRKEGDHDRFHEILGEFWKSMRNMMFEVKQPRSRRPSESTAASTLPDMSTRSGKVYQENQATELIPIDDEVTTSEKWSTTRTEQAIIKIIDDADWARDNSHPGVFETLWTRNLARLSEVEQAETQKMQSKNRAPSSSSKGGKALGRQPTQQSRAQDTNTADVDTEMDMDMDTDTDTNIIKQFISNNNTLEKGTNTTTNFSYSDQFPAGIRPSSYPLAAWLPPTLPQIMTVYISPYQYNASGGQPYIWPDAPVHSTSYPAFLNGIRIRAGVPEQVGADKFMMVFAYGWNDSCCVVRNEDAWHKWFMNDLRNAAVKGGVGVWRMKVCCTAA